ncbi:MAG: flagellar hook assembly protein FlgD [Gemmatimonadota bacterium]|nr:flagellar hook assembly protein FlgD [Gemmatimonadota bacterium]
MSTAVGATTSAQQKQTTPTSSIAGGAMGKDQFVKLLVAQMTHQDPLNPMDSSQMAAQLAQFSSVEQLMNISTQLQTQSDGSAMMLDALDRNAALGMIGRSVTAVSDEVTVSGHAAGDIQADIPSAGAHVRARIVDATGQTIGTADYGVLAGGRQTLDLTKGLKSVPNGSYTVKVEMVDADGKATALTPIQTFKIDGLRFGTNGAVLTSGTRSVPIGNVIGVASN